MLCFTYVKAYIKYRKIPIIGKGTLIKYKTLLELHMKIADFADP